MRGSAHSVSDDYHLKAAACVAIIGIMLLTVVPVAAFDAPDPFSGEGKQNFILRCTKDTKIPGFVTTASKRRYCKCVANKAERYYPSIMQSIDSSDPVTVVQQKLQRGWMKLSSSCLARQRSDPK